MAVVLVLEVDGPNAELLSDELVEIGADSVEVEDADAGTALERALYEEPDTGAAGWSRWKLKLNAGDESTARALLARACAGIGIPVPESCSVEPLEELDWVRATQAQFPPIRVSSRLWIVPTWERPPDPNAVNVVLDPGRAFGTGSHPTTFLCLEWLEREIRGGETVLDYGCGSGILAIAARKLGAAHACGVDIDPQALEAARANAELNAVDCKFMPADAALDLQADIVVANILASPLTLLAPVLAAHTRTGGRLALAGLLAHQGEDIARVYTRWFDIDPAVERQGWTRISATRRNGP